MIINCLYVCTLVKVITFHLVIAIVISSNTEQNM